MYSNTIRRCTGNALCFKIDFVFTPYFEFACRVHFNGLRSTAAVPTPPKLASSEHYGNCQLFAVFKSVGRNLCSMFAFVWSLYSLHFGERKTSICLDFGCFHDIDVEHPQCFDSKFRLLAIDAWAIQWTEFFGWSNRVARLCNFRGQHFIHGN